MSQRLYDLATAKALMRFAYPEYREQDPKPYEIRENGVFATDAFRDLCPPGTIFDWTPADEMGWPGSPNPDTAPFLPIPFDAAQLAAAMIDGPGQSIAHAMEHRLGYPLAGDALSRFSDRMMWMRYAVAEAYAAAAAAQSVIGEFDHDQENRAHAMAQQYEEANEQANDREGVFEQGITSNEASARRARAVASVADLKAQAERAQAAVAEKWKAWRKAMVRQLLRADSRRSYIARRLEEIQSDEYKKKEPESEAEQQFWFQNDFLELEHWAALADVSAREAAMLLCQRNPRKTSFEEAKTIMFPDLPDGHLERLDRRLSDYAAQNPRSCRSLWDWYSAAREMQIKLAPEAVLFMEHVAKRMASDSTPAAAPVAGSANDGEALKGLATAQIAVIFDGLPYTAENWPRRLSDIKWLQPALVELGAAGGATSLWCPATLARLIHGRGSGPARQSTLETLNKRFKSNPVLEPWRAAWNEHYEMFNDAK